MKHIAVNLLSVGSMLLALTMVGCQSHEDRMIADAQKDHYLGGVVAAGTGTAIEASQAGDEQASGTLLGAFVVETLEAAMSESNRLKAANLLEYQASNQWQRWRDNQNHTTYSMKSGEPAFGQEQVCRKYELVAQRPDQFTQGAGVACRQSNGNWLLQA